MATGRLELGGISSADGRLARTVLADMASRGVDIARTDATAYLASKTERLVAGAGTEVAQRAERLIDPTSSRRRGQFLIAVFSASESNLIEDRRWAPRSRPIDAGGRSPMGKPASLLDTLREVH